MSDNNKEIQSTSWMEAFGKVSKDEVALKGNDFDDYISKQEKRAKAAQSNLKDSVESYRKRASAGNFTSEERSEKRQEMEFWSTVMITCESNALQARVAKEAWEQNKKQEQANKQQVWIALGALVIAAAAFAYDHFLTNPSLTRLSLELS